MKQNEEKIAQFHTSKKNSNPIFTRKLNDNSNFQGQAGREAFLARLLSSRGRTTQVRARPHARETPLPQVTFYKYFFRKLLCMAN